MKWKKHILLILKTLDSVGVALSAWLVIISFFEADFWHFTDPSTSGFSVSGAMALVFSIVVTPIIFAWRRFRTLRIPSEVKLILKIIPSLFLMISSLPQLNVHPFARTGLLGFGMAMLPFIFFWILHEPPFDLPVHEKSLPVSICLNKVCLSDSTSNTFVSDSREVKPGTSFDSYFDVKLSVAILAAMSIRHCTGSINVFYENWAYSVGLFLFAVAIAFLSYFKVKNLCCCKALKFQKPVASLGNHAASDNRRDMSVEMHSSGMTVQDNQNGIGISKNSLHTGNSSDTTLDKQSFKSRNQTFVAIVIGLSGSFQGITFGYLIVIFAWLFGTPSLLCRWSGLDPYPNGVYILLSLMFGVFATVILRPKKLCVLMLSVKNYSLTDQKRKIRKMEYMIGFTVFVIGLLSLAAGLQLNANFGGSILLCLVLPYCFSVNVQSISWIVEFTNVSYLGCLTTLPGFLGFIAALLVVVAYLLFVIAVTPQLTVAFLGRFDIFFIFLIVMVFLTVVSFFVIFEMLRRPCDVNHNQTSSSQSVNQLTWLEKINTFIPKQLPNFGILVLLVPIIAICIGPRFASDHCLSFYEEAIGNVPGSFRNTNTISDTNAFSVLSWNILLGHDNNGRGNLPCIGNILEELKPNVVGLQESDALPPFWGGKDIIGFLAGYLGGGTSAYYGVDPLRATLGVGALTSLQVTNRQSYILPQNKSETLPNYSLLNIDCLFQNHPIKIFIIHAVFKNWSATPEKPSPLAALSTLHIQFLVEKVGNSTPAESIILMGDFNLNPNEEQLDIIYNMGFQNALLTTRDPTPPSTITNRFAVIDHIFYKGLIQLKGKVLTETERISDHHPVMAYFQLPT